MCRRARRRSNACARRPCACVHVCVCRCARGMLHSHCAWHSHGAHVCFVHMMRSLVQHFKCMRSECMWRSHLVESTQSTALFAAVHFSIGACNAAMLNTPSRGAGTAAVFAVVASSGHPAQPGAPERTGVAGAASVPSPVDSVAALRSCVPRRKSFAV